MRSELDDDWVKFLPIVVESLNLTPRKKLGWVEPAAINSIADDILIQKGRSENCVKVYQEANYSGLKYIFYINKICPKVIISFNPLINCNNYKFH